jgi:hypothetical protein
MGGLITVWDETTIYKIDNQLYSGNPENNLKLNDDDLLSNGTPKAQFKLNDRWVLDLITQRTYDTTELYTLGDSVRPSLVAREYFEPFTSGCYIVKNIDNVSSISMTKGVFADLAYKLKEIEYTVEEENTVIKGLKEYWLQLVEESTTPPEGDDEIISPEDIQDAYNEYIEALGEALESINFEEDYYAI